MQDNEQDTRSRLEELAERYGLHVGRIEGDGRHLDAGRWEHHRYRFDLFAGAELLLQNGVYRQGTGFDRDPEPIDIIGAVLTDASCVEPYDGFGDDGWIEWWADDLGGFADIQDADPYNPTRRQRTADVVRKARDDYRKCRARLHLLREHVGADETAELIELAREL